MPQVIDDASDTGRRYRYSFAISSPAIKQFHKIRVELVTKFNKTKLFSPKMWKLRVKVNDQSNSSRGEWDNLGASVTSNIAWPGCVSFQPRVEIQGFRAFSWLVCLRKRARWERCERSDETTRSSAKLWQLANHGQRKLESSSAYNNAISSIWVAVLF